MSSSDADRLRLSYVPEVTFGVTPSATLIDLRHTGESLRKETASVVSSEIRDDRQIADIIRTGISSQGSLGFELSYGEYDPFLAAALQATAWGTEVTVGPLTTISFAAPSGNAQVVSDSATGFVGILTNQWVRISGATNAENNGLFKVTAGGVAASFTIENATGVVEAASASITVEMGAQIVNGVALTTYSIEKQYTDLTNIYEVLTGLAVNNLSLSIQSGAIITGSLDFLGKTAVSGTSSAGSGYTVSQTNSIMNAIDNVLAVFEGGAVYGITQANINIANNIRAREEVGELGAISMGSGALNCSGTLQAYFASHAVMDKYLAWTASALAFKLRDVDGNDMVIDFPQVRFTSGQRVAGSQNSDIIADMGWQAYVDATEDVMVRIVRWPA